MQLKASPDVVRQFITTPERILDYYPSPISCGVLEENRSFFCQGKSGISLLELQNSSEKDSSSVTLKVSTATPFEGEITEARIMQNLFFIMFEDWQLQAVDGGTRLSKTWRDIEKKKMRFLPLGLIVRFSAKAESGKLISAWDRLVKKE